VSPRKRKDKPIEEPTLLEFPADTEAKTIEQLADARREFLSSTTTEFVDEDDMRAEYNFTNGVRGKHYRAMQAGYAITIHKEDGTTVVRDALSKEEAGDMIGAKPKNLQSFNITTPQGHHVTGFICMQSDHRLGCLVIDKVDGEHTRQVVFGMPKTRYPYGASGAVIVPAGPIQITAKLDGTNLTFYPLKNASGDIIEIVPKVRRNAMCGLSPVDPTINYLDLSLDMLQKNPAISKCILETGYTISTELYGYKNPHMVVYSNPLDIRVLIFLDQGRVVSIEEERKLLSKYDLAGPMIHFHQNAQAPQYYHSSNAFFNTYGVRSTQNFSNLEQAYRNIQQLYEGINRNAGKFILEGSMWAVDVNGSKTILKCKPPTVEEKHFLEAGGIHDQIIEETIKKAMEVPDSDVLGICKQLLTEDGYSARAIEQHEHRINSAIKQIVHVNKLRVLVEEVCINMNSRDPRIVMPILHSECGKDNNGILFQLLSKQI